jgi:NhaP-type Na+/H+ or K+/H+ antiporter
MSHARFENSRELWAAMCLVVVLSILMHGLTASGVMGWLDRERLRRAKA